MTDLRAQLQSSLGDAYTIERELGGGGMSRVFVATERALNRRVVIKILPAEMAGAVSGDRFNREIALAARLQQANIVPVLTAGDAGGVPYFTMPYVEGQSLRARLAAGGELPITDVIGILKEVARALAYAHAQNVVHRDIKPDNVLLSGGTAMVTDFGVAKALTAAATDRSAALTGTGLAIGTPAYMSPEQATGDPNVDHRADIYAFGCLAYELLAGAPPFAGRGIPQIVAAHITEDPDPVERRRPAVPFELASLVARCLAKDPADRPQSANDLIAALDAAQAAVATPAATVLLKPTAPRRAPLFAAAAAIVVVGAALLLWPLLRPVRGFTSVAVLPFENIGGDTANAYFADGMADELTTALSKVPGLRVPPTSSSFRFRGKGVDVKAAASDLNVASVLQASVQRAGGKVRIRATLTNARTGGVAWGSTFEREVKDLFAVEDDLTKAIIVELRPALSGATGAGAATLEQAIAHGTRSVAAYDLYLRGIHLLGARGPGVRQSIPFFEQAIAEDSTFARAYAQMAHALAFLALFSYGPPNPLDDAKRGLAVAMQAIAMDSTSVETRAALGSVLGVAGRIDEARVEYERWRARDSTDDQPSRGLASLYTTLGRTDDAVNAGRRATELDPKSVVSQSVYARALLAAGRRNEALDAARRTYELDSISGRSWLATAEYFYGDKTRAHDLAATTQLRPGIEGAVAFILAATGDKVRAAELERRFEASWDVDAYAGESLAALYLGRGDTTRALSALERSALRHEPFAYSLTPRHPIFDSIRQSARFAAIIKSRGLDVELLTKPVVPTAK